MQIRFFESTRGCFAQGCAWTAGELYVLFYGKEMKIINLGQVFLYIGETYEQLRELSLLVTW